MKPHKHAELIKQWADGAIIEGKWSGRFWEIEKNPAWDVDVEYRIKPEPKPDVEDLFWSEKRQVWVKTLWDGETDELKSAEVLK